MEANSTRTGLAQTTASSTTQGSSAASATALMMLSALLSGVLGLVRLKYVNFLFGAGVAQDAYRAAFRLPDLVSYFLVGSAASVSLITMMQRFRSRGDDEGADRALSVVLSTMFVVLSIVTVIAVIFTPFFVRLFYDETFFHDARGPLCISLTRILLPAQLFFFVGSMMSARLQVRQIFTYQACTPVIYNLGIVLGAFFLHRQFGVYSLAFGVLGGVIVGSALLNTLGALRSGLRFTPIVSLRDADFRAWLVSAAPLMLGVSLVMFDSIFFNKLASKGLGGVTLINNAKDLFNAPFNVIGPAAGTVSLPLFAALFQSGKAYDFSASVGRSVSRLAAVGFLVSAWMLALAPWLNDLLRGGRFNRADAMRMTSLFEIFAVTLALWAVQGIYARAFYAAGDTRTPAIAGTIIVVASAPMYWMLYRWLGLTGLAVASDLGIILQTCTLMVLLQRRKLVSLLHLEFDELWKACAAALASGGAAWLLTGVIARHIASLSGWKADLLLVSVGSLCWAAVAFGALFGLRARLPYTILRRRRVAA